VPVQGICERIINFFYQAATGPKRIRTLLTPLFAAIFFCLILGAIGLSFFLDRFFGFARFIPEPFGKAASLPFLAAGIWLWLWSAVRFLKMKGTPVPVNPPPVLVTDGPYAYSRNPMMTGVFLFLAGIGIWSGSALLSFIVTPAVVVISILEFRCIEEPELERRFGKAYKEYRNRTPIIIPRIRRE
jgi:protein-S-isoprenylcysteine O-methyltransferase Ste14